MNTGNDPATTLIRGAHLVTLADHEGPGDLLIRGERIAALGPAITPPPGAVVVEAAGLTLIPGLVQAHVHLCQALFRGLADDLELLPWLRRRILPLEAAHDEASLAASARVGLTELLLAGTTALGGMETVHGTEVILEAIAATGVTAVTGGCLIDEGEGVPARMLQSTEAALAAQLALASRWRDRVEVSLCPRFALTCSPALLRQTAEAAADRDLRLHTHVAENRDEVAAVRARTGLSDLAHLDAMGLLGPRTSLAHAIHLVPEDVERIAATGTALVSCPSANLKLASGIAPLQAYLDRGIPVGLGADGAPCNNRLDPWTEMRTAALLQKVVAGPEALPARRALALATLGGARALGREREIGSLEPGKRADLVLVDLEKPWLGQGEDRVAKLVYAATARDVHTVIVGGRTVVRRGELLLWDVAEVQTDGVEQLKRLQGRM